MNKLIFTLLACLLFIACQNTPKSIQVVEEAPSAAPTAPASASAEAVQQASESLSLGIKTMEDLRKKVDALPAKIKKEKATEIEVFYANFEGMIAKQTGMLNELKAATNPAATEGAQETSDKVAPNTAQLQEINEAVARYAKEAQAMQEAISKMGGGM